MKKEEYELGTVEELESTEAVYMNGFNLGYEAAKRPYNEMLSNVNSLTVRVNDGWYDIENTGICWKVNGNGRFDSAMEAYMYLKNEEHESKES